MNILVVDDSVVFRTAISQALSEVPGFLVSKTCSNGKIAIDFLQRESGIDLVILDLEMPVMDGIETIKEIRKFNKKIPIIVFSSFTTQGAEKTITALQTGANDFVGKVSGNGTIEGSLKMIRAELVPRIEALCSKGKASNVSQTKEVVCEISKAVDKMQIKPKLICIGSSTGGPEALMSIFKTLEVPSSVPMLLVQHMPPMFTQKLAEMLDKNSCMSFSEAKNGDVLKPGHCYIAPGDYHMTITKDLKIILNQDDKVCFVRPSVDVLLNSVADNFSGQVLSIILTGMGEDGANGSRALKEKNAYQFTQDKESCVVWGMPGAVMKADVGASVIKLADIPKLLTMVSKRI
ncbi:chemotaxis-specific protein-glutamate methyltransferase CheB [Bacteriovorax sp. Seq25_V]|uniref:chemotaxis-specific protein-glutamate methyltransferase CheB n=1 Tax=Bacteriovorax sp. Seq25_V TaxID=1201288 RepID=UPI00038A52F3|nr:chemotaxis-specific protein-glutamate methyltransferase CheB [Bacteriovorax sp. Seq25_V]EQC47363.1 protein-glutamate methylesterase CheB [Bacteriovorax sp. Seq25_V]